MTAPFEDASPKVLAASHAATVIDTVIATIDRGQQRRTTLLALVNACKDCGPDIAAMARHTAAACAQNPVETVPLLRRAERRIGRVIDKAKAQDFRTLAEMARDGVTLTALEYVHAAFGAAAAQLEGN